MEIKTAIEVLKGELSREFDYTQGSRNMYIGALELALESLEKQIPTIVADTKNLNKLLKLVDDNSELEVIAMVDEEVVADEGYARWLGSFGDCRIDEIYHVDERIYFKSLDEDELIEEFEECIFNDGYIEQPKLKWVEDEAKKQMDRINWEKVIVVDINTP